MDVELLCDYDDVNSILKFKEKLSDFGLFQVAYKWQRTQLFD